MNLIIDANGIRFENGYFIEDDSLQNDLCFELLLIKFGTLNCNFLSYLLLLNFEDNKIVVYSVNDGLVIQSFYVLAKTR